MTASTTQDAQLTRWSTILLLLASLTVVQSLVEPLSLFLGGTPITLHRDGETWNTTYQALAPLDAGAIALLVLGPELAWVYVSLQVWRLAHKYRRGILFDSLLSPCFLRIGMGLAVMGVLDTLAYPAMAQLLYCRRISPWLGDTPLLALIRVDLIMAGAFFFVLGKIMMRGAELQDLDQLTV
ncbi:hypothetical protein [Azospirillum sp. sgz302134]